METKNFGEDKPKTKEQEEQNKPAASLGIGETEFVCEPGEFLEKVVMFVTSVVDKHSRSK